MKFSDQIRFSYKSVLSHRMSSFLTLLGITIGITAVVLLTSIGEGIHRFVLSEFTQFGTKLVAINPGRATTHGVSVGVFGTERPLSLGDAAALQQLSFAQAVVPVRQGNAEVEAQSRQRRTTIYGAGPAMPETFQFRVASGRFPNSICKVVRQGGEVRRYRCQFSWWCDGRSDQPRDRRAWRDSILMAHLVYTGSTEDPTSGALWYHATSVRPPWHKSFLRGPQIGRHVFYRSTRRTIRHNASFSF